MSGEGLNEPLLPPVSEVAELLVKRVAAHADAADSNPVLCAYRFDREGARTLCARSRACASARER